MGGFPHCSGVRLRVLKPLPECTTLRPRLLGWKHGDRPCAAPAVSLQRKRMPELPEVEIARRNLLRWFDGRRVVRAEADRRARTFRGADPAIFEHIRGRLATASRTGK